MYVCMYVCMYEVDRDVRHGQVTQDHDDDDDDVCMYGTSHFCVTSVSLMWTTPDGNVCMYVLSFECLPSLIARIVPWRQACAHTHMFTFVSLETRHVLYTYTLHMFSFVLFTFALRMSEAASTIICGHWLPTWLIGGL